MQFLYALIVRSIIIKMCMIIIYRLANHKEMTEAARDKG